MLCVFLINIFAFICRQAFVYSHCQVFITSYQLLASMEDDFCKYGTWDYVVLDEGHTIKNPTTKISKAVHRVASHHRLLLTGESILSPSPHGSISTPHGSISSPHVSISTCLNIHLILISYYIYDSIFQIMRYMQLYVYIGTAIQNNLMEFYRLLSWATRGTLLGTHTQFATEFAEPIVSGQDPRVSAYM